jgi:hypothetical protein
MNMLSVHNNFRDVQLAASDIYFFKRQRSSVLSTSAYHCMQSLYTEQQNRYKHQAVFIEAGFQLDAQGCIPCNAKVVERLQWLWGSPRWTPQLLVFTNRVNNNPANTCSKLLLNKLLKACLMHNQPILLHATYFELAEHKTLLVDLAKKQLVHLVFAIGSTQTEWHNRWEPGTKRYTHRFKLMQDAVSAGIPCGFLLDPVVPGESLQGLYELFRLIAQSGIRWAAYRLWQDPLNKDTSNSTNLQLKNGFISQFTHYAKRFELNCQMPSWYQPQAHEQYPIQPALF